MAEKDNVVLFPKWKQMLESESLQAMKSQKYEEALQKFDQLIEHDVKHQEIMIGKIICLMEMGLYDQAEMLAKSLIELEDDGYYHYMHIYLTILFQTNQYIELIDLVSEVLKADDIPDVIKEQFLQLHAISQEMNRDVQEKNSRKWTKAFQNAIDEHEYIKQWNLIEKMRNNRLQPNEIIIHSLTNEHVHPLVKTAILLWCKDKNIDQLIPVVKNKQSMSVNPVTIYRPEEGAIQKEIQLKFKYLEQEDPTLHKMMTDVLKHYIYVRYPIAIKSSQVEPITEALKSILHVQADTREPLNETLLKDYIEEMQVCSALYLSIIDE